MVMAGLGHSAVHFDHAHAVRWMVWFAAVAFIIFYSSSTAAESLDGCGRAAMWFAADFVWSFKDAARIDYIVSRALILEARGAHAASSPPPRRSRFARQCTRIPWAATTAVVSLMLYWSICDLVSGTLIVHTSWAAYHADAAAAAAGATTTTAATAGSYQGLAKLAARHAVYRNIILLEEGRVLLSLAGMLYITLLLFLSTICSD
ncbi:hypothetical protein AMAG_13438 [Allomyces macrogynus ATCC 38327]|uniref:Uncharacterized protein n=1 Tax=Allomyces macrogynus (strain ATCC 38327) TaxID=578462 RepID=A0A0L0T249_ALLM3|nr:hypothetical protein AMAG_13438 [Allomyces macrogynus ATCC 38327]|eukprot:KNE68797.1 hypothetical protein AMAG_13438 [Allomyces macrogynus ATCC 38327]